MPFGRRLLLFSWSFRSQNCMQSSPTPCTQGDPRLLEVSCYLGSSGTLLWGRKLTVTIHSPPPPGPHELLGVSLRLHVFASSQCWGHRDLLWPQALERLSFPRWYFKGVYTTLISTIVLWKGPISPNKILMYLTIPKSDKNGKRPEAEFRRPITALLPVNSVPWGSLSFSLLYFADL